MTPTVTGPIIIETTCPICGKTQEIEVNYFDFWLWSEQGMSAQDAFPYLTANEREALISGICPKCWDNMFTRGDEDEE